MTTLSFWIGFLLYFSVLPLFSERIQNDCHVQEFVEDVYEERTFAGGCAHIAVSEAINCSFVRTINTSDDVVSHLISTRCGTNNIWCDPRSGKSLPRCHLKSAAEDKLVQKCCCRGLDCGGLVPWIRPEHEKLPFVDLIPILVIFIVNLAAATLVNNELKCVFIPFFRGTICVKKSPTRTCRSRGPKLADLWSALNRNNVHLFADPSLPSSSSLFSLKPPSTEGADGEDRSWRRIRHIVRVQEYSKRRNKLETELYKSECRQALRKWKQAQLEKARKVKEESSRAVTMGGLHPGPLKDPVSLSLEKTQELSGEMRPDVPMPVNYSKEGVKVLSLRAGSTVTETHTKGESQLQELPPNSVPDLRAPLEKTQALSVSLYSAMDDEPVDGTQDRKKKK